MGPGGTLYHFKLPASPLRSTNRSPPLSFPFVHLEMDFNCTRLFGRDENITISSLFRDNPAVVEFWTSTCSKCPGALDELGRLSEQTDGVNFIAVNLDDRDRATEMVGENPNIVHVSVDTSTREEVKESLRFDKVPYYVCVGADGKISYQGDKFHKIPDFLRGPENEPVEPDMPAGGRSRGGECAGGACSLSFAEDF